MTSVFIGIVKQSRLSIKKERWHTRSFLAVLGLAAITVLVSITWFETPAEWKVILVRYAFSFEIGAFLGLAASFWTVKRNTFPKQTSTERARKTKIRKRRKQEGP